MRISFVIIVLTFAVIFCQFYFFPENFQDLDEMVYAYGGLHLLNGDLPYVAFSDNKPIGIYLMYALSFLMTPFSLDGIHLLLALCKIALLTIFFFWARTKFRNSPSSSASSILPTLVLFLLLFHTSFESEAALTEIFSSIFLAIALILLDYFVHNPSRKNMRIFSILLGGISLLFSVLSIIPLAIVSFIILKKSNSNSFQKWTDYFFPALVLGFVWVAYYFVFNYAAFLKESILTYNLGLLDYNLRLANRWTWLVHEFFFAAPFLLIGIAGSIIVFLKHPSFRFAAVWFFIALAQFFFLGSFYPHQFFIVAIPLSILFIPLCADYFVSHQKWVMVILAFLLLSTGISYAFFRWAPDEGTGAGFANIITAHAQPDSTLLVLGYRPDVYWYTRLSFPHRYFSSYYFTSFPGEALSREATEELSFILQSRPPDFVVVTDALFLENPSFTVFWSHYQALPESPFVFARTQRP